MCLYNSFLDICPFVCLFACLLVCLLFACLSVSFQPPRSALGFANEYVCVNSLLALCLFFCQGEGSMQIILKLVVFPHPIGSSNVEGLTDVLRLVVENPVKALHQTWAIQKLSPQRKIVEPKSNRPVQSKTKFKKSQL